MADAEYPLLIVLRWRHVVRQLKHILHMRKYFHTIGEYLKQFAALKAPKKRKSARVILSADSALAIAAAAAGPKAKARPRNLPSSSSSRLENIEEWIHLDEEPDPETGSDND